MSVIWVVEESFCMYSDINPVTWLVKVELIGLGAYFM